MILDVPKPENAKILIEALEKLVPLGLKVEQSVIRDKLNIPAPAVGAELLGAVSPVATPVLAQAANREQTPAKSAVVRDIVDNQVRTMERTVGVYLDDMVEQFKKLLDTVHSLEEFRDRLIETYPDMTTNQLADAIADGLVAASLAGRDDILRGL